MSPQPIHMRKNSTVPTISHRWHRSIHRIYDSRFTSPVTPSVLRYYGKKYPRFQTFLLPWWTAGASSGRTRRWQGGAGVGPPPDQAPARSPPSSWPPVNPPPLRVSASSRRPPCARGLPSSRPPASSPPPPRVVSPSPVESSGCGALKEAEACLSDVPLTTPFTITSLRLETVSNITTSSSAAAPLAKGRLTSTFHPAPGRIEGTHRLASGQPWPWLTLGIPTQCELASSRYDP